jgi:hypothetical protein
MTITVCAISPTVTAELLELAMDDQGLQTAVVAFFESSWDAAPTEDLLRDRLDVMPEPERGIQARRARDRSRLRSDTPPMLMRR